MPLSGFSIETRSERGDISTRSTGVMSWSRCISLEMYPRWWSNSKIFYWIQPPKKLGEDEPIFWLAHMFFKNGLNGTNQAVKMTENDRETWEVLQTTSTSLTNFEDFWKRRSQPVLPCSLHPLKWWNNGDRSPSNKIWNTYIYIYIVEYCIWFCLGFEGFNRKNPLEASLWWFCIGFSWFFYLI